MSSRRKKILRRRILLSVLLLLLAVGGYLFYQWWEYRRVKFVRYPEFGIEMPEEYAIHGIDVSKFQQTIAWEEVQAMQVKKIKLGFVFMKATEGIGNVDPLFHRNWRRAKDAGIVRGAYHFFIASKDGKMQAENFIDEVELRPGDLPPVLDIEQMNGSTNDVLKREVKKWLETVENYYHVKPVIYTNIEFYNRRLGNEFDSYPLWVAHYYQPHQPSIKREWVFWQHNDEGHVNGILPKVDFDVFSGDSLEFRNFLVR